MNLNIRINPAPYEDTKLISVEVLTLFEVDGHKFFSHYDNNGKYVSDNRLKCSEYFSGLAVTYQAFLSEEEAIEATKKILIERSANMDNYIEKAISQYGYANKED